MRVGSLCVLVVASVALGTLLAAFVATPYVISRLIA